MRAQDFAPGTPEYEEQRRLGRMGLLVQGAPAAVKTVVIVFMTDGQDNTLMRAAQHGTEEVQRLRGEYVQELQKTLQEWGKESVVIAPNSADFLR